MACLTLYSVVKRALPGICLILPVMLFTPLRVAHSSPWGEDVSGIITRLTAASAAMETYRAEMEVSEYRKGRAVETKRFRYTFKKPDHLRIDMESPNLGMVLVYPDEEGKVSVRPGGWAGFVRLHLSPDSALLRGSAGQRIDQTDLVLLVRNIAHSLTDRRRGGTSVSRGDGRLFIEVLAEDHFRAGVLTLYRFAIDTKLWLPVEVVESTPDGKLRRTVHFRNLRTAIAVPDGFFRSDREDKGDGRRDR